MFRPRLLKNFRGKEIKTNFEKEIEPHEILLDSLAKKHESEWGISEKKLEVPLLKQILRRLFYFSIFIFLILFLRTFQFQIVEGKKYSLLANENRYIFYSIQAERGVIYDRYFKQLVFNVPSFGLICEKKRLPESEKERENVLKEVAKILKENVNELEGFIRESKEPVFTVAPSLDHQTLIILETKIDELPGFKIEKNSIREYKDGPYFSQVIGYLGKIKKNELEEGKEFYSISDSVGRSGIERTYEDILRKNPGKIRIERDALGRIISKQIASLPQSGKNLLLWLDADLQKKATDELKKGLNDAGSSQGVIVALNPETGGVLALVSIPSFDNNVFSRGQLSEIKKILNDSKHPLFNQVISGTYPPGSTIKPLIASAVLEEKIISPTKKIDCKGFIEVKNRYHPEIVYKFRDWKIHNWTDMRKAIAQSCNVYFYTVGGGYGSQKGLGPSRIKKYLELFGWGQKSYIDLPSEGKGLVPSPQWKEKVKKENWWDGDTYHLSIGQGDLSITPIQVVNSFAAIANGGRLFQPMLVKAILDNNKNIIKEISPKVIRDNFIDPQNLQIVREGMRQAVTSADGSSHLLNDLPVAVAAKTGTAETGKKDVYDNWVTIFAPYDNPQIVLTVMIEDVKGMRAVVLPVAKSILDWYFSQEENK